MESQETSFQKGDRIRIIIDEIDPDMHYHGEEGEIIEISFDDAASVTGNSEDNFMFKVELENGEVPEIHFRRNDLKKID